MMKQVMECGLEVLWPPQPYALLSPCPFRQRPATFGGKQHGGFRNLDSLGTPTLGIQRKQGSLW